MIPFPQRHYYNIRDSDQIVIDMPNPVATTSVAYNNNHISASKPPVHPAHPGASSTPPHQRAFYHDHHPPPVSYYRNPHRAQKYTIIEDDADADGDVEDPEELLDGPYDHVMPGVCDSEEFVSASQKSELQTRYSWLVVLFMGLAVVCFSVICFFSIFSPAMHIQSRVAAGYAGISTAVGDTVTRLTTTNIHIPAQSVQQQQQEQQWNQNSVGKSASEMDFTTNVGEVAVGMVRDYQGVSSTPVGGLNPASNAITNDLVNRALSPMPNLASDRGVVRTSSTTNTVSASTPAISTVSVSTPAISTVSVSTPAISAVSASTPGTSTQATNMGTTTTTKTTAKTTSNVATPSLSTATPSFSTATTSLSSVSNLASNIAPSIGAPSSFSNSAATTSSASSLKPSTASALEKRVFFSTEFDKLYPSEGVIPMYVEHRAQGRNIMIDIGANDGKDWAAHGVQRNMVVYSFEPSPTNRDNYMATMKQHGLSQVALVRIPTEPLKDQKDNAADSAVKINIPTVHLDMAKAKNGRAQPFVYLIDGALSNKNGILPFLNVPCAGTGAACGKSNRIVPDKTKDNRLITVPSIRFSNIEGIDGTKVFVFKLDVEGFELDALQGASEFLQHNNIPFIALEFGTRMQTMTDSDSTKRNIDLLEFLHQHGYSCYHMRGFSRCPPEKSNKNTCMWEWATEANAAPTFEQYARNMAKSHGAQSDLICKLSRPSSPDF